MRAKIGITSGDPAGIGLEVILKALPHVADAAHWILFTSQRTYERNSPKIKDGNLSIRHIGEGSAGIEWGQLSREAGAEALACLAPAAHPPLHSEIATILTPPVTKH